MIPYDDLVAALSVGDVMYLADGSVRLRVGEGLVEDLARLTRIGNHRLQRDLSEERAHGLGGRVLARLRCAQDRRMRRGLVAPG